MTKQINNRKYLKPIRRHLRNNLTPAEATLWKHIQNSKLGQKFRRQHSVGNYVLDFYCPESKLNVELDGEYHFTRAGIAKDEKRDAYLSELNITTLRFENVEVFENLDYVLGEIKKCFIQPATPTPSLAGEELKGWFTNQFA